MFRMCQLEDSSLMTPDSSVSDLYGQYSKDRTIVLIDNHI